MYSLNKRLFWIYRGNPVKQLCIYMDVDIHVDVCICTCMDKKYAHVYVYLYITYMYICMGVYTHTFIWFYMYILFWKTFMYYAFTHIFGCMHRTDITYTHICLCWFHECSINLAWCVSIYSKNAKLWFLNCESRKLPLMALISIVKCSA